MGSRFKEDEKNERIIRGLLKQPANRKCINCNSLGPQYVCTTFSTFVCTTCSGIHREFTHRVKSVSMAKFTSQEVSALQSGGNERVKQIYFKEWDSQCNSAPDSSNVDRLRDFIKHVYVDRRYSGGARIDDRPPKPKMGDKEELYDSRRNDAYRSGSRSPSIEDARERRYSERSDPGYGGGSPVNDRDSKWNSDYGRSPVHGGVVNDWRRVDRFSDGKKSDGQTSPDVDPRNGGRSPEQQRYHGLSIPPVVRPVRDILGDNAIPLRVSEPPKSGAGKVADGPASTQRSASSSSLASSNGNPVELKREDSLIDFGADPEPPVAIVAPGQQATATPPDTHNDNWAFFGNASDSKASQTASGLSSLESVLAASAPATVSEVSIGRSSQTAVLSGHVLIPPVSVGTGGGGIAAPSVENLPSFPYGAPAASPGLGTMLPANGGTTQWPGGQYQQQPLFQGTGVVSTGLQFIHPFTVAPNSQGSSGNPAMQAPQAVSHPLHPPSGATTQTMEVKSGGRRELPEDLFTAKYPFQSPIPNLQGGLVTAMGYMMPYNPSLVTFVPAFTQPQKPANPFDVANETSPHPPAAVFPSMTSLQATLPNVAPSTGLGHTTNPPQSSWAPSQSFLYPSAVLPFTPFGSAAATGAFHGQQGLDNLQHSSNHGFGNEGASFSSLNPAGNPSVSRNPFG